MKTIKSEAEKQKIKIRAGLLCIKIKRILITLHKLLKKIFAV
jgi:hypothetical protein